MGHIDGVSQSIINNKKNKHTTKAICSDSSELFVTSKLNMAYKQAVSNQKLYNSRRNLRKLVEDNHLDKTV